MIAPQIVISVSAPCNGSGKTSMILAILSAFPETFAVTKFTTIYREEQFCPAKDHDCACHRLDGDYLICRDPAVLSQPDTDTGKIWNAGALQTLWCVAKPEGYPPMIQEYLSSHLRSNLPLLIEGNTILHHLRPHLRLAVVNPTLPASWWKQDATRLLQEADFVVVNPIESGSRGEDSSVTVEKIARVKDKSVAFEWNRSVEQWEDKRIYKTIGQLLRQTAEAPVKSSTCS